MSSRALAVSILSLIFMSSAQADTLNLVSDFGIQGKFRRCKYSDGKVYGLPKTAESCSKTIQVHPEPNTPPVSDQPDQPDQASIDQASKLLGYKENFDPTDGYDLLGTFAITGSKDPNSDPTTDFNGCNFNRIIFLGGDKALQCTGYGYTYSYRPLATLYAKGPEFVMVVNGLPFRMTLPE